MTPSPERGRRSTIAAVLFDADHTLLDFDRAQRAALRIALKSRRLPFAAGVLARYRRINDELWERYRRGAVAQADLGPERFRRLLQHMGASPRGAASLGRTFLDALARRGDLLPGCRRTLASLRRRFRLGVVTNGYDRVQRSRLRAAGLARLFDVVVTSEACGFAKPDPRILGVALGALGLRPAEAVYVGDDAANDGGAASAAGVRFVWIDGGARLPRGVRRPWRRVGSLEELREVLEGL